MKCKHNAAESWCSTVRTSDIGLRHQIRLWRECPLCRARLGDLAIGPSDFDPPAREMRLAELLAEIAILWHPKTRRSAIARAVDDCAEIE